MNDYWKAMVRNLASLVGGTLALNLLPPDADRSPDAIGTCVVIGVVVAWVVTTREMRLQAEQRETSG